MKKCQVLLVISFFITGFNLPVYCTAQNRLLQKNQTVLIDNIDSRLVGIWATTLSYSGGEFSVEKKEVLTITATGAFESRVIVVAGGTGLSGIADGPPGRSGILSTKNNNQLFLLVNNEYKLGGYYEFTSNGYLQLKDALTGATVLYKRI